MERERVVVEEAILRPSEAEAKAPPLEGVPTGVPGLDELFFRIAWEKGQPVRKPLGGIPLGAVVNLTGMPDTGKSLMAEQFTVKQAALGERVCFVTVETPAPFVVRGLSERARAMGIDFTTIEDRIVLLDAASYHRLREDLPTLMDTLAHIYRTYRVSRTVVDSVTGLYEAREMMARSVVRALYTFCKKWHQTAVFVSQKRSAHEELSAEAAGGLREDLPTLMDTLAHIYRTYRVSRTVVDSVTGLYEAREMMARSVVRALYTFCKKWHQTAVFVSQKRSAHEELSAEAAGGYAVGHIVDCTMVLSKELLLSARSASAYGLPPGSILRLFRIDGCRLCGHDTSVRVLEITELGLVKVGKPLSEVLRK